jgi:1,4-dihydroxy-2-naphthoate octaprenyltransferase
LNDNDHILPTFLHYRNQHFCNRRRSQPSYISSCAIVHKQPPSATAIEEVQQLLAKNFATGLENLSSKSSMTTWRAKFKGMFMLFRILAVMVWACTAAIIASAAAALNGYPIDWPVFAFVVLMAALVQGYPAHIINEIYDWQSGSDRLLPSASSPDDGASAKRRPITGGSKVIMSGLLNIRELWWLFYFTTAAVAVLAIFVGMARSPQLLWFIVPGYLLCIFYTLPPFRFAYRPFVGEYCGGFAGIVLLVSGAYYAQTFALPPSIVLLAAGLGFLYAAIMIFFHYVDFSRDRLATPPKRTSVVYLGLEGSRRYAMLNAAAGIALMSYLAFMQHPLYALLVVNGALIFYCHYRARSADDVSIVFWGRRMTYGMLLLGLLFGILADSAFIWMAVLDAAGFWLHRRFGRLRPIAAISHA